MSTITVFVARVAASGARAGQTVFVISRKQPGIMLLSLAFVLLSQYGGTKFYLNPLVMACFSLAWLGLLWAWVFIHRPASPAMMTVFRWPVIALILSALVNFRLDGWLINRLGLASAALLLLLIQIDADTLRRSLLLAGLVWPLAWLLEPVDNRNIQAVWPLLFAAVVITSPASMWRWLYFGAQVGLLLWLGSRGAIIGLAAALAGYYVIYFRWRVSIGMIVAAVMLGTALLFYRWNTAMFRLFYFQRGIEAFLSAPLFGVGPGGLRSLGLIFSEGVWQPHAHNFLLSVLAETGLIGLAGLGLAGYTFYRLRPALLIERWHVTALLALAAHSLVDEPLWWPGPLLAAALIISSIKEKNGQTNLGYSTGSRGRAQAALVSPTRGA